MVCDVTQGSQSAVATARSAILTTLQIYDGDGGDAYCMQCVVCAIHTIIFFRKNLAASGEPKVPILAYFLNFCSLEFLTSKIRQVDDSTVRFCTVE